MAVTIDTYANIPGSPSSGDLHFLTDSFYTALYYNGASWDHFVHGKKVTPPVNGDFAWVNQGSASVSTVNGGVTLLMGADANISFRIRKKAAPSTPYTVTAAIVPTLCGVDYHECGLMWRQNLTGKLVIFGVRYVASVGGGNLECVKLNSPTEYAAPSLYMRVRSDMLVSNQLLWLRLADDGTSRIISFSCDGINFIRLHSVGRADFLTADEVGFYIMPRNATYGTVVTLLSWGEA